MTLVLLMAGVLWGIGHAMRTPPKLRWIMIGLLWLAVVIAHLVLPEGSALRQSTGGTAAPWLLLGGIGSLVLAYVAGLRRLKNRAQTTAEPTHQGSFSEAELDRYSRHIVLRELGGPGQKRLKEARVLVIGAGGLGAPVLSYLAAAGVGTIGVIDDDIVSNSNLQRQVIFRDKDIRTPKVFAAESAMKALNPYVIVRPYNRRLDADNVETLFNDYDLIVDGSDTFDTRYLVNRAAVATGKPLISGAIAQWEGQISLFYPPKYPCYACIFPQKPADGLAPSCAEAGVIGPLPGVIGSMMAAEAIKCIAGTGTPLAGQMLIYDALYGETRRITLAPDPNCPICSEKESP